MPIVHFILPDGAQQSLAVTPGTSVMLAAVSAGVRGISGDCGGSVMCATCHVYVEDAWRDRVPAAESDELAMLECVAEERLPGSRLSCQIQVSEELDGLTLRVPAGQ